MIIAVPKETFPGEKRVALIPANLSFLQKAGFEVQIEKEAGVAAGYPDRAYGEKGAKIISDRKTLLESGDIILQVRGLGSNQEVGKSDLSSFQKGKNLIAFLDPLSEPQKAKELADTGITAFSMEMMPRITRAQTMDALSSMATIAGYKAVLVAANTLSKMCPMLMTAAGTISPAKFFIIGAGVAGLQAIAMSRKLGAIVEAYDVRPAVKEQVQSLGAKFVEIEIEAGESEDKGGYAKELGEDFYRKQRELMTRVISESDVVITTAAIPGKKAPILVTKEMVEKMAPGSVVVDLAAERGGNCELTQPGQIIEINGVTIMGPLNIPTSIPYHASQMYSKNITNFLLHLSGKENTIKMNMEDEITKGTLICRDGEVVHPQIRGLLGL